MSNNPLVSIICLTFNQEAYVRDCFEGFLSQITDFDFEVLVYDDASTDATPDIIKHYSNQYPEVFKPTLYKVNNYSRGLGYVGLYTGIEQAKGKYVAYCEGDDYWSNNLKLQKQVDFLESNPQYVICAHETLVKNEDYPQFEERLFSDITCNLFISTTKRVYSFYDTLTGNIFHVSSLMYRNKKLTLPKWLPSVSACDMVLYMLLAREGNIYVLPEAMSVYRGHSNSLTSSRTEYGTAINFYLLSIRVLRLMNRFWERQYQDKIYPIISQYYVECSLLYLRKSMRDINCSKHMAHLAFYYSRSKAFVYLLKGLMNRVLSRICRH